MTLSDLTNEQLDKLIAERRGEKVGLPHKENSLFHFTVIPSYTTDPRYAMELLKEMPRPMLKRGVLGDWLCGNFQLYHADTPERAIAEAWYQWKGEK